MIQATMAAVKPPGTKRLRVVLAVVAYVVLGECHRQPAQQAANAAKTLVPCRDFPCLNFLACRPPDVVAHHPPEKALAASPADAGHSCQLEQRGAEAAWLQRAHLLAPGQRRCVCYLTQDVKLH